MTTTQIRFKLGLLIGQPVNLVLKQKDGGTANFTGYLQSLENGYAVMSSRNRIEAIEIERITDCWRAKGKVEP